MKDNYLDKLEQVSLRQSQRIKSQETQMKAVQDILQERGPTYGDFRGGAKISQYLKKAVATYGVNLTPTHKESLDMIMHKVARLLNGDPMHVDTWQDIVGYATLAVEDIEASKLDDLRQDNAV